MSFVVLSCCLLSNDQTRRCCWNGLDRGGLELNPRFGGGFPFSYEAGVNFPKALIQMLKGEEYDPQMLVQEYGHMFSKNDYLMEIKYLI